MIDLEMERKKLELSRVEQGVKENEFKILERQADISRIKESIEIQTKRLAELKQQLREDKP